MRKSVYLLLALLLVVGSLIYLETNGTAASPVQSSSSRPELEYLKAVNGAAPPQDPQLLFLLMGAYANANQQAYAPMRRNSNCGSCGGAAPFTAFRYSSSGREELDWAGLAAVPFVPR